MGVERPLPQRLQAGTLGFELRDANPIRHEPGRSGLNSISRSELFGILYLLGIANALAAVIVPLMRSDNVWQALADVFNVVTVAATAVGIHLLRRLPDVGVKRCDWLVTALVALLLLVPHRAGSWLAVTGLALYAIARDRRYPAAVASGSVFLAIAASSFWGPVLVQACGSAFLVLDAALAAALLGVLGHGDVDRIGNVIVTSDQTTLLVTVWCSFLPNLLYGFLWWTVIARAVRPEWQRADVFALLAVGALVLTANTLRLALMGLSAPTYQWIHGSVGGNAFNIGLVLVIAAIALRSTAPAPSSLRC